MAKCHTNMVLASIAGLIVGVLLGAGAVQYGQTTAASIVALRDTVYRNSRSVNEAKMQGLEDEGLARPQYEWREQRTENAAAVHGVANEELPIYCPGQSSLRRSRCLINHLNNIVEELNVLEAE